MRKVVTMLDETRVEEGRAVTPPRRRAWSAAVIANPYAGTWADSFEELEEASAELGTDLLNRAAAAVGGDPDAYGKAAIVGRAGGIEAAHACLHPRLGVAVRAALGHGRSMMPSTAKRGGPGATIDVPLHHVEAALVRSHFDAVELSLPDAPFPDEIVVAVAVGIGGRPHARLGGLRAEDISVYDGIR